MRKIYIFIFFLVMGKSFGQVLQNANWIFGNGSGVTFNTSPPTALPILPSSVGFEAIEGSAIVSDNDGNVLFFTEGETVWLRLPDGSNQVIATGLYGEESSAQNAVIVHKPGSPTNYYIFTIKGGSSDPVNRGLYYSEIEINYPSATVLFQNQPLNDDLGNPINGSWGNVCEAITAVNHSDNYQYWVETFVGMDSGNGKILSYLVTDNGVIDQNPQSTEVFTPTPNSYALKINGSNIAIGTVDSGVYLGAFNNTTGNVDINQLNPVGNYSGEAYTLEFSPSGNNLYFGALSETYLMGIEVNAPSVLKTFTTVLLPRRLQIGIDDKIYLITGSSSQYLSVLSSPDNILSPGFTLNSIPVSNLFGALEYGLPQLVPIQPWDGPCMNILKTQTDVLAPDVDTQQASNLLIADDIIYSGATAIYHAGNTVLLSPGFHSQNGSKFRGYIEGCSGEYVGRTASGNEKESNRELSLDRIGKIDIYPNPSTSSAEISLEDDIIRSLTVYSIDGRIVFFKETGDKVNYTIDISNFLKGIYIVSIQTTDGKSYSEKLVKN